METNFQKIQKNYDTEFDIAKCYYSVLFGVNNLHVTKNELNLITYAAITGTISTSPVREKFCKEFKIPQGSFYNMVAKLQKLQILVKDDENKIKVNSSILPDFTKPELLLMIKLEKNGS